MDFKNLTNEIIFFIKSSALIYVFISFIIGFIINYAGHKVYKWAIFLSGMIPGALIGVAIGGLMDFSQTGIVFTAIFSSFAGGSLAIFLTNISIILLGSFASVILAAAMGAQEPVVILIAAVVGGGVSLALYNIAIIVSTSVIGSALLMLTTINIIAIVKTGHPELWPGDIFSYFIRLVKHGVSGNGIQGIYNVAIRDLISFSIFCITGIIVQVNLNKILKLKKPNNKTETETEETIDSTERIKSIAS